MNTICVTRWTVATQTTPAGATNHMATSISGTMTPLMRRSTPGRLMAMSRSPVANPSPVTAPASAITSIVRMPTSLGSP